MTKWELTILINARNRAVKTIILAGRHFPELPVMENLRALASETILEIDASLERSGIRTMEGKLLDLNTLSGRDGLNDRGTG
jgi:hypothetical protein